MVGIPEERILRSQVASGVWPFRAVALLQPVSVVQDLTLLIGSLA
jgi:hypothetical protein